MELLTLAAISVVMIATVAGIIAILKNVSDFYRERFHFSIWSGVFMIVIALSLAILSVSSNAQGSGTYIVGLISAAIVAITIYNDIRLAGFGWGILAICLQSLLSVCLLFIVLFAIVSYIASKIFNVRQKRIFPTLGFGMGLNGELRLLVHFLHL